MAGFRGESGAIHHMRRVTSTVALLALFCTVLVQTAAASADVFGDGWGLGDGSVRDPGLWSVSVLGSTVVDVVGGEGHIG